MSRCYPHLSLEDRRKIAMWCQLLAQAASDNATIPPQNTSRSIVGSRKRLQFLLGCGHQPEALGVTKARKALSVSTVIRQAKI